MTRPMTMAEKILCAHAGLDEVSPGQLIECDVDVVLANDVTAPIAIREFKKIGTGSLFDKERVVLVPDHYVPNKDIKSAKQAKIVRDFAREQGITHYFEVGCMGVEHALLPECGIVGAGDLVIGADSHTCTYGALGAFSTGVGSTDAGVAFATGKVWLKVPPSILFTIEGSLAPGVVGKDIILYIIGRIGVDGALYRSMEFRGSAISALSIEERMSISNMAIEAGGKAGLIEVDDITRAYLDGRCERTYTEYHPDADAIYEKVYEIDAADIPPTVAWPHLPSNTHPAADSREVAIDQVVIGSCTNGRITDMRSAAAVLKGRTVHPDVRCIVIPATQEVYRQCIKEGLTDIFLDANCAVSTPTCGPCLGGYMGILAAGERAVATTNRNFVGRMGDPTSEVYLSSPAVAAASAVLGHIGLPEDLDPVAGDVATPGDAIRAVADKAADIARIAADGCADFAQTASTIADAIHAAVKQRTDDSILVADKAIGAEKCLGEEVVSVCSDGKVSTDGADGTDSAGGAVSSADNAGGAFSSAGGTDSAGETAGARRAGEGEIR